MLACDIKIPNMPPTSPPGGGNQYRTLSIPLHQQAEWHQRVFVRLFLWIEFKDSVTLTCDGRKRRCVTVITSKITAENQQTTFLHHDSALQPRRWERATQTDGFTGAWQSNLTTIRQERWLVTILAFMSSFYVTLLSQPLENNPEMFLKENPFTQNGDPPPVYLDFRWMKWPESSYKKSWDTSNPNACVWLSKSFFLLITQQPERGEKKPHFSP